MTENMQSVEERREPAVRRWKPSETRSLNADERISFSLLSLYLFIFCACTYLYWPSLPMKIVGGTAALLGLMLFSNALFNCGTAPRKHSMYTRTWYLVAFMSALLVLFSLRMVVRNLSSPVAVAATIYGSLALLFIVFRKAMVQILMALLSLAFVAVTVSNWNDAASGRLRFLGALEKCGQAIFKIEQIGDVANTLIAGNYMGYLKKVDYLDEQINMLAVRTVRDCNDDELRKTKAILSLVSNEIRYVSDPADGEEHAKDPLSTLISGGGDCEDQTVLLCSLLESVGVTTYMVFTDDHVFALVRFTSKYPELDAVPWVEVEGRRCHVLDAADPGAIIGYGSSRLSDIKRVFDVRQMALVDFTIPTEG
ncbi:hypothetical protein PDESU_01038 [Pontiella desulfatans]|uniref:Transglutaminase-like domain-containing protein n=1 Tax=Pontiella desulfatans TaxID=2750659 RepID=A0A6C2TXW0_PONDE|nr:transglutaminase-like domain-containing protein [Pontiella desulfatans]VGO12485.1 hypothetical protein PDESU_01038 [Pontiella desulfatans]